MNLTNEKQSNRKATHLAIWERVSKSRLFIDVLTSRHPIYCKYLKERKKKKKYWRKGIINKMYTPLIYLSVMWRGKERRTWDLFSISRVSTLLLRFRKDSAEWFYSYEDDLISLLHKILWYYTDLFWRRFLVRSFFHFSLWHIYWSTIDPIPGINCI